MERQKHILVVFLLFLFTLNSKADDNTDIYKAYINNDMTKWKRIIDKMNKENNINKDYKLKMLNYQYGYIAWCIGNKRNDEAEEYIDLAETNIQFLEDQSYKLSLVNSYKSALFGFKIGLSWYKAPFLGPKSINCAIEAINIDKSNPYGCIQYGNTLFYRPKTFGGSKTLALTYYKKAQALMEYQPEETINNWNYLSLLVIIAKAYTDMGKYFIAKEYYEKILKIEPNFLWVKDNLYPQLLMKI